MNAAEVIEAFKQLSPEEKSNVATYVFDANSDIFWTDSERYQEFFKRISADLVIVFKEDRRLSGRQLGDLAQKMVEAEDPEERLKLRERIVEGFYGN